MSHSAVPDFFTRHSPARILTGTAVADPSQSASFQVRSIQSAMAAATWSSTRLWPAVDSTAAAGLPSLPPTIARALAAFFDRLPGVRGACSSSSASFCLATAGSSRASL